MRSPRFARDDNFTKPEGEKMPTYDDQSSLKDFLNDVSADFMNNSG
jgi:hypothetical protein